MIPHETLMTTAVINHTHTERRARIVMPIQVSYDGDLEFAMALMKEVANAHPRVLETPVPDVHIKGFGENGIDLSLVFWIPDPEEGSAALQSEVYLEVWRQFKKHGIVVPYPQREVRMLATPPSGSVPAVEPAINQTHSNETKPSVRNWDDVI